MSKENPLISFLVPMWNESKFIEKCLQSLFAQEYADIEIRVFDGGSQDNSHEIVCDLFEGRENCHLRHNPKRTQAAAWNQGILHANGDILAIVSGHAVLAADYAGNLVETLQRTGADMVGGPTFADSEGYIAKTIALAMNSPFGVGGAQFHYTTKEIEVDSVFMGACWRSVYQKIGGFDEEMVRNQDDELSYRLRENGGRIVCNPAIKSRYFNRASLGHLWNQYYQYGYYKVRVLQKHPRQMSMRQFVPPTLVLGLLGSLFLFLLSLLNVLPSILLPLSFVVPALYLFANIAASIALAVKKRGKRYLPLLPISYAILHISYGVGFLVGLVKFRKRWGDKEGQVPVIS